MIKQSCRVDDETLYKERTSLIKVREDYTFLYTILMKKIKEASLYIDNINFDRINEDVRKINKIIEMILAELDEAAATIHSLENLVVEMNDCRWR